MKPDVNEKTTFGRKFFADVGINPEKWVDALRVRLGTDAPSDQVLFDFFSAALLEAHQRGRREGMEWQPIETAPKDGTEIILFGPNPENDTGHPTRRVTSGWWCTPEPPVIGDCGGECRCPEYGEPEDPFWCCMHGGSDSGWMSSDGGFTVEWPPTHWMPLPPAPSKAKEIAP